VQQPDLQVPYLLGIDGLIPTCEFIEAYLHSVSETDSACGVAQVKLLWVAYSQPAKWLKRSQSRSKKDLDCAWTFSL
jgi:hypothetical protein